MPKKLIFLTHGVTGSEESCWLPWVKKTLSDDNTLVIAPSYPRSDDPDYLQWKETFCSLLDGVKEYDDLYIVGHSLGGFFVLKILGDLLYLNPKLKGVVLVAPTSMTRPERRKFYAVGVNWENIRKIKCPMKLLFSDDDPKISVDHIKLILKELPDNNLEYRNYKNLEHFIVKESPEVLDAIKSVIQST